LIADRRIDLDATHMFSMTRMRELERAYDRPVVSALSKLLAARAGR
jgi:hypothetical protein